MWENVEIALDLMWKGMLGIFVVVILIMLSTQIISWLGNKVDARKERESTDKAQCIAKW